MCFSWLGKLLCYAVVLSGMNIGANALCNAAVATLDKSNM